MSIQLKNTSLYLDINEPGEHYIGARFDWTAQIVQITYKNKHTFCTTETPDDKLINKRGRGLYNEFGIDKPLGYEDCSVGEKFPKIGVGFLTKDSPKPYDFFHNYKITPHTFSSEADETRAHFTCETKSANNKYAFRLEKSIELNNNSFTIFYSLINFGSEKINTNEYVHNFLSINGKPVNKDYELSLPFKIETGKLNTIVNPSQVIQIDDDHLTWNAIPKEEFFIDSLNTSYSGIGKWRLIHKEEKVGIEERTGFNISKMNLWGSPRVVSPELFFSVNAAPGEQLSWSRTYTLFTID